MKKTYLIVLFLITIIMSITAISAANTTDTTQTHADISTTGYGQSAQTQDDSNDNQINIKDAENIAKSKNNDNTNSILTAGKNKTIKQDNKKEDTNYYLNAAQKTSKKTDANRINIPNGTYYLNSTTITEDIEIIGSGDSVIIANNNDTLFNITNTGKLTLVNLTIQDYNSTLNQLITNNGTLEIIGCTFKNNTNLNDKVNGTIIHNSGNLTVTDSEFSGAYAQSRGSSIFNNRANVTIIRSTFTEDESLNVGGSIFNFRGTMKIYDSKFSNNRGVSGAGVYSAFGDLYINNTDFIKNTAKSFYGGAIYSTGAALLTNCLFSYNHATYDGGAITNTANLTAINCSFESNTAGQHGGVIENIAWTTSEKGNLTLLYCNFTENMAVKDGGVIVNYNTAPVKPNHGTITARGCIFKLNSAGENGGVICNYEDNITAPSIDLENNVFIDNEANEGNDIYSPENDIKSVEYNWWSTNEPNWQKVGATPTKWVVMTFTNTTTLLEKLETNLLVTLNSLNTGETLEYTLPQRDVVYLESNSTYLENFQTIVNNATNVVIPENENITVKIDNQKISLVPIEANITCKLIDNNQTIQFIYNLPDSINGKTTIKANGKTILNNTAITDGKLTINYTIPGNWNNNEYMVNIVLLTDDGKILRKNISATIPKRAVDIKVSIIQSEGTIKAGDTIQIAADITTGNQSVAGGKVVFKINGKTIMTNVSVVNGKAIINYTIPYSFNPNDYNITVKYSGTGNKEYAASDNVTLTVSKQNVHVNPNSTMYLMSEAGISTVFSLLDSHNNYITQGKVCYKVNGITLKTNITVTDGVFAFDYVTPSVLTGQTINQNLTIVLGENKKYNSLRLTIPLVIS